MYIKDEEDNTSFSKRMNYSVFTDICAHFCQILERNHEYSGFSTINKIRMFTIGMGTRMMDGVFELYAEDLLSLTGEQFNDFRQAEMIKMMGESSS